MARLLEKYVKTVKPALQKEFGFKNIMQIPRIEKVVINVGIGKIIKDDKAVDKVRKDLALLSGQKTIARKAKKSIAGFKIREGMEVGYMVTLRGKRMYDFIDRLISIALPRSKDFRGIDAGNFDERGNLNIGIKEHNIFPEISYESLKDIFSLQITVVTKAQSREQAIALLRGVGFPLQKS
ncbi:MAG: 50S ribosomal protein L5 [Candidatus Yanofskybacteria bacterium RIFCSPHIGHO2_01_FULL_45_42]|uniref:Large ribosomal subunit protein uL5 n=3 Tax=Candidatus Yanofskyibacteriota TaxID=1752733 RepID=A0A1F8H498_9BACT|nr:MAG: 50S ribosomal protein L5 [Candidatus Yanofskybacteria bacterium RIFCSPHIGHO2_01_FULL_45_42]OGN16335.1 MAG: 50S ribosomal protein L5 [Candidatus Yanofskybacteria bacterium RIFCSPHIGHO2_02_FULL_46_19]OGN27005.1 MAG: 50S ribosomal protein L5 [Candidatus Yanofskybacteria bacterium RIFCSPLOWO2_01_FULL_45_72]OGN32414.1 MAG: 50S ribosomal protein L5 [Candidatus Yanofskybacteria bacterium RIFCSPLOWO2_02_FULL_45_18]